MTDTILKIALEKLTKEFDNFISCCIEDGKPVAPKNGDIMKARACMPDGAKNSFGKRK